MIIWKILFERRILNWIFIAILKNIQDRGWTCVSGLFLRQVISMRFMVYITP